MLDVRHHLCFKYDRALRHSWIATFGMHRASAPERNFSQGANRDTHFEDIPVSISRTGYTGDLGYEIWMNPNDALAVWDLLIDKGAPFGITPTGLHALDIARVEAGLILLDVDYISSRHAIVETRKSSPYELGLGWTVKMKKNNFIGKNALEEENKNGPLWNFVGIEIQWPEFEKHYRD